MEREAKLNDIDDFEKLFRKITERGDCLSIGELAITGKDLIDMGIKPGPLMGDILDNLLTNVLRVPEHNTKEWLLERANELISVRGTE